MVELRRVHAAAQPAAIEKGEQVDGAGRVASIAGAVIVEIGVMVPRHRAEDPVRETAHAETAASATAAGNWNAELALILALGGVVGDGFGCVNIRMQERCDIQGLA